MITITITDASATNPNELRAVAQCLISIAGGDVAAPTPAVDLLADVYAAPPVPSLAEVKQSIDAQIKAFDTPVPTIAAADSPDAGAPESTAINFHTVHLTPRMGEPLREVDPKVAFGAVPNVPAAPASFTAVAPASPTVPAVPQVTSTTPASVPAPPVPNVPGADAPADEDAPSDAQFDKTGLPWDARIHSRGRSMTAAGTWRSKRGVDDATVAAVVAELRAVPGVPVATLADDVASAEATWAFKEFGSGAAVPPPPPPVAVPAPPASTIVSFPAFMQKYVPHIEPAGKISQATVNEILVAHGVPNMALLSARVDLLPTIAAQFDALIAA